MAHDLGPWEPLRLAEVEHLLRGAAFPWWVAGGWAIDLHLGGPTRHHDDLDILVLRDDQLALRETLDNWDLHAADPPGSLRPWRPGQLLPTGVHDVWCRRTSTSPWSLQVMLDVATDGVWTYRRDPRIKRSVEELDGNACHGNPRVLAPEVQLLYKSAAPRGKDQADFLAIKDLLGTERREWLVKSLDLTSPHHPWLSQL